MAHNIDVQTLEPNNLSNTKCTKFRLDFLIIRRECICFLFCLNFMWQSSMVPIGFQLLAVLGGKALLLSKMALMLASINGLKRVSGIKFLSPRVCSFIHSSLYYKCV